MFVMPQFWCWCGIRWCAAQDGEQRYSFELSISSYCSSPKIYKNTLNGFVRVLLSDMRVIGESEGYSRAQEQLLGTLVTAQDSRGIRQKTTNNCNGTKRPTLCTVPYTRYLCCYNNEHHHRNIEHFI
jgi:hypothetical protein